METAVVQFVIDLIGAVLGWDGHDAGSESEQKDKVGLHDDAIEGR
jgi:hypothetical protein